MSKKMIAFVAHPGLTLLELVGTLSVLKGLAMKGYQTVVIGETTDPVESDTPLKVIPDARFNDVPNPAWLVVTGGESSLRVLERRAFKNYLVTAAQTAEQIVAVSSGALMLARLGLLTGKNATTHWKYADQLEASGVRYVRKPWLEEGKFATAAGVSGGIDLGLHLLDRYAGRLLASTQQLFAEYDPQTPFGGIDWSCVTQTGRGA